MPIKIPYATEEEWLKLRLEDVTSTEISALFSLSPYMTEFELYHHKKNKTLIDFSDNTRIKWGKRLEAVIAQGVAEDLQLQVEPITCYMRHSEVKGMGSSFDYAILNHKDGPGLMEIKNVDSLQYKKNWSEDEAPAHIETQVQHQMEVADVNWCLIVVLSGGNDPRVIRRERDKEVGKILCDRVRKFWHDIETNNVPQPNYIEDAEFIVSLHQSAGVKVLEIEAGNPIYDAMIEYKVNSEEANRREELKQANKAKLLELIGDEYNKVKAGAYTLSCGMTKDTPPTIITPEMVGQEIGGRKGYRNFRITIKEPSND